MVHRLLLRLWEPHAFRDAARLTQGDRALALFMARHAVSASGEVGRGGHWSRVLRILEARSRYRPF